jgi:glycosyltransferase involved in cell wall biosynthesis
VSRLRVLLVLHELTRTGAPRLILDAFEAMREEFEVRILSIHGGGFVARAQELAPTVVLRSADEDGAGGSAASRAIAFATGAVRAQLLLRRWRPDVIYINSAAALPIARLKLPRVPVILHVHESPVLLGSLLSAQRTSRDLVTLPSSYIAVSAQVKDGLVDGYSVDPDRVVVIPGFVDAGRFASIPRPPNEDDHAFTVGGIGTPSWWKGTDLWLLTASEIKRRLGVDAVRFIWVGVRDDDASRQFVAMAAKLNVREMVQAVRETTQPLEAMQGFDLLAVTSWEDSFPLTALEAMGLGKPVICFRAGGGVASMVGDTGVVVHDVSPVAMADAILELMADKDRLREMGRRARQRVLETFTTHRQVPAMVAEIRRAAGK